MPMLPRLWGAPYTLTSFLLSKFVVFRHRQPLAQESCDLLIRFQDDHGGGGWLPARTR